MPDTARSRVALIQFPGSNCEWETKAAAEAAGITCDIFRWNRDPELLAEHRQRGIDDAKRLLDEAA